MTKRTCETCRWFNKFAVQDPGEFKPRKQSFLWWTWDEEEDPIDGMIREAARIRSNQGLCRRMPNEIIKDCDDWCGEHQPKEKDNE